MNKQAALERLAALENEAAALRKVIEQPENKGLWRPEAGEEYCMLDVAHGVKATSNASRFDKIIIETGNRFPSIEAAQKAAPLMSRANKIIAAALQVDPDAGNRTAERGFTAYKPSTESEWHPTFGAGYGHAAYVHTREQAQAMAATLNAQGVQ